MLTRSWWARGHDIERCLGQAGILRRLEASPAAQAWTLAREWAVDWRYDPATPGEDLEREGKAFLEAVEQVMDWLQVAAI
jgi:hypothetical protein